MGGGDLVARYREKNPSTTDMNIDEIINHIEILQNNSETMQPEVVSAINQTVKILNYIRKNLNFKSRNNVKLIDGFISGLFKTSNADINETINYMVALHKESGVMTYETRSAIGRAIDVLKYIQENSDLKKYEDVGEMDNFINGLYKVI